MIALAIMMKRKCLLDWTLLVPMDWLLVPARLNAFLSKTAATTTEIAKEEKMKQVGVYSTLGAKST